MDSLTKEQIERLAELSEKATPGEWRNLKHYSKIASLQMLPAKRLHASNAKLIPIGKLFSKNRDGAGKANGDFIVALVNWFRANRQSLSQESVRSEADEIPSYESIAEMLPSVLSNASAQCPLCGQSGVHQHTPQEIVIYRNGVKYGRALQSPARVAEGGDRQSLSTEQARLGIDQQGNRRPPESPAKEQPGAGRGGFR